MGNRKDEKGKRFEFLIHRIDEALDAGYYVEAMAITYALFEERTYRLLDRLGVAYRHKDKLFDCLEKLKKAINDKTVAACPDSMTKDGFIDFLDTKLISSNLVQDILDWRAARNDVIHDLAKTNIDYDSLQSTSENGRKLFATYTAIIMRLKKMLE